MTEVYVTKIKRRHPINTTKALSGVLNTLYVVTAIRPDKYMLRELRNHGPDHTWVMCCFKGMSVWCINPDIKLKLYQPVRMSLSLEMLKD